MDFSKNRITHKIVVPSYALSNFLRRAVFDEEAFSLFMENSAAVLSKNGIKLDPSISEDALMRLRFLVTRARDFVLKEKINAAKFEELFGIIAINQNLQDIKLKTATISEAETSVDVYYSETQSESHRGASTEFKNQDSITESRSDHWSTTKWNGREILHPEDRFIRTPLLDSLTLGMLIAKIDGRLKDYGA